LRVQLSARDVCAVFARHTALALAAATCAPPAAATAQERPWTLASDSLLYTDTDNVLVVTSQLGVARALDDDGGTASASAVVDVVSAASVDVVSQASLRFDELRGELNLAASHAFGDLLPSLNYRGSVEPDYVSHGAGAGCRARLGGADTVASAHYRITFDTIGRSGTPFSTFSRSLTTHDAEIGVTQNVSTKALVRAVYTLTVQAGYLEKPYRFVPLFDTAGLARARDDGVTLDLDTFDDYRLPARPPEEVPDLRVRHALGLRGIYYLAALDGSLRADYRFYFDDWGMLANTVELALDRPLSRLFALVWTARAYRQGAAWFYRGIYVVGAPDELPELRTVDRRLSPYTTLSFAPRLQLYAGAINAYLEAGATYSRFDDFLYLDHVVALVGQGGVTWAF
jgi:hypothetical protein